MRARLERVIDTGITIISFAPVVLYVYGSVLRKGIKHYACTVVNDLTNT